MTDRDRELDAAFAPHVHKPDEVSVDIGGGCFLDRNRVCGPDCTAFLDPDAPTAAERCHILTTMGSLVTALELLKPRKSPASYAPNVPPPYERSQR